MMRLLLMVVLVLLVLLSAAPVSAQESPWVSDSVLAKLWPSAVPFPTGLRLYQKSQHAQNTVILNGHDSLTVLRRDQDTVSGVNPNRIFPWRVSGGMDHAQGWRSYAGVAVPHSKKIKVWVERIEAGASRPLPKLSWSYPVGTAFVDVLTRNGECFELRMLKKHADGWRGHSVWESEGKPQGYRVPDRKCLDCHRHAGGWLSYGTLLRGGDHSFSFPILKEGTLLVRRDLLDAGLVEMVGD